MLKIWGRTNSINVQKVLWACDELGLAYERSDAGMQFGVVNSSEYRALNPNGRVPTIIDEGFVLWESNAIVRYLGAKHGTGTLMPDNLQARADADRWMDWCTSTLGAPMLPLFWQLIRTPADKRDSKAIDEARIQTEACFAILDHHLSGKQYISGDRLSVGDIPIGCYTYRWMSLPIERPKLAYLDEWYARLRERPAFAKNVMLPLS